ncbi:hypothetical protein FHY55_20225 [Oceanicola sp. D3]|uniref:hypothetical protein n=1 Tax=Oceanicola sp. D3 TaxID=2587163 RepID=UPI0011245284|nr:hypothetical protein [Oceanicola sp. D3]QDC11413.1 hypothetical protein FHY55_20225 [Oceanicola sp. D3]
MRYLLLCLLIALPAAAQDRPPPKPGDPDDFVRYIFETNACVMTEDQLLKAYQESGYGIMGANNAVIAVSEREDIEVLSRNPFRYRYYGSDYCGF